MSGIRFKFCLVTVANLLVELYCAQKETHLFNVAISNELFD